MNYNLPTRVQIMEATYSKVPLERILGTRLFALTRAELHPDWLKEARVGEHVPESVEYGISAFTFRSRRPFHPQRLHDVAAVMETRADLVLEQKGADDATSGDTATADAGAAAGVTNGGADASTEAPAATPSVYKAAYAVVRAKGPLWLASKLGNAMQGVASLAGRRFTVMPGAPWWASVDRREWPKGLAADLVPPLWQEPWGDRQNELVVIGKDMDHDAVRAALDACLLTDAEMAGGSASWEAELPNPWKAQWEAALLAAEHHHGDDDGHGHSHGGHGHSHGADGECHEDHGDEHDDDEDGLDDDEDHDHDHDHGDEGEQQQQQPDVLAGVKQVLAAKKKQALEARAAAAEQPGDVKVRHYGVFCDITGRSPIVGVRYHKRGQDYDICDEVCVGAAARRRTPVSACC